MGERALSLNLGREELVFLLWLLGVNHIPGLSPRPLGNLTVEQAAIVGLTAEHSLRARGLLGTATDGRLVLDRAVAALLLPCAFPEYSITAIRRSIAGRGRGLYSHLAGSRVVAHTVPEPAIHRFVALAGRPGAAALLAEFVEVDTRPMPALTSVTLPETLFREAQALAARGSDLAPGVLTRAGLDAETAYALASALTAAASFVTVTVTRHAPDTSTHGGVTLLVSTGGFWALTRAAAPETGEAMIMARPLAGEAVGELLAELALAEQEVPSETPYDLSLLTGTR
jgi:hypothetical protein